MATLSLGARHREARRLPMSQPGRTPAKRRRLFSTSARSRQRCWWKFGSAEGLLRGKSGHRAPTEPAADSSAPIHDRQMVVLERSDWLAWLDLNRPEAELLRPLPAGSLKVEQVR